MHAFGVSGTTPTIRHIEAVQSNEHAVNYEWLKPLSANKEVKRKSEESIGRPSHSFNDKAEQ